MDVPSGDVESVEVLGELFGHTLGQGGDQHAVALLDGGAYLADQVVDLVGAGPYVNWRIEQTRWADDLFDNDALGLLQFIVRGCSRNVDDLVGDGVKFIRLQWAVVQGRWQAKSVFHQRGLARTVAAEHRADLWHRHVAFVHHQQEVIGEVVEQAEWAFTGLSPVEVAAVILDAITKPNFLDHL